MTLDHLERGRSPSGPLRALSTRGALGTRTTGNSLRAHTATTAWARRALRTLHSDAGNTLRTR